MDITTKCNRGTGIINKIQTILETMFFGSFYFEVGKNMIESMLLGSILNNIEVAYNLTKTEIEKLQKCHEMGFRKLLSLSSKTPKKMLYLLTGYVPIELIIQRRLNYKEHYKTNLICDSCKTSECDQKHLLECSELIGKKRISFIHSQLYWYI